MLTIRVLGTGLIPRGLGLAPRMTPTEAGLTLIQTIIATRGLSVQMLKPDGKWIDLTKDNVLPMYRAYDNVDVSTTPKVETETNVSKPVAPAPKFDTQAKPVSTETVRDEKTEVKADDKAATEKKDESSAAVVDDLKDDNKKNTKDTTVKVINTPKDHK